MKGPSALWIPLVIMVIVVVGSRNVKGQGLTPSQCKEEKNQLETACRSVVMFFGGKIPKAECCQLVQSAHVECVCPYVSRKLVAALGGLQRAIRMIEGCGGKVPRNFKCGSVITPP